MLQTLPPAAKHIQIKIIINHKSLIINLTGNGCIEFPEFVQAMYSYMSSGDNSDQELIDAFNIFDKNGDGHISFQGALPGFPIEDVS